MRMELVTYPICETTLGAPIGPTFLRPEGTRPNKEMTLSETEIKIVMLWIQSSSCFGYKVSQSTLEALEQVERINVQHCFFNEIQRIRLMEIETRVRKVWELVEVSERRQIPGKI